MNYKLIIFDMDGTFVDSRRFHAKIFFGFFQKYYHYISYETCYELVGRTVKKIFSDCGIAQEDQGRYFELLDIYYEHEGAKLAAVTGIPEGFTELLSWLQREKCRTAVVTNSLNRVVEKILDCHGLWNLFDNVIGADRDSEDKTERCRKLIQGYDFSPKDVLMVGDTEGDIILANSLGADACFAKTEIGWYQDERYICRVLRPVIIIETYSQLKALLENG